MEKFTFFYEEKSPFSQWYLSDFTVGGIKFNCAEQYMMYMKAKLFEDEQKAIEILQTNIPREQKWLGQTVRNFNQEKWESEREKIVYDGNYAKFTQNLELKEELLKTAGTTLVEASPINIIWGVGLAEDDDRILDRTKWRGLNLLGKILTQLREDLMKEKHD
jgi:ribA/ribD-fused uncharacterized protein